MKYNWPGNIRELQHMIERAVILGERKQLTYADIMPGQSIQGQLNSRESTSLAEMEKQHISRIIHKNRGNITKAANDLGVSRTALHRRIRKYGI